jgi:hypothetical protein
VTFWRFETAFALGVLRLGVFGVEGVFAGVFRLAFLAAAGLGLAATGNGALNAEAILSPFGV